MSISGNDMMPGDELVRHFFGGFVRLHILHHAAQEAICGVEMMSELQRHGYRLGPGTLYPILHQLAKTGFIACQAETRDGKRRKNYRITRKGRRLLAEGQTKLRELFSELVEGHDGVPPEIAGARRNRVPRV